MSKNKYELHESRLGTTDADGHRVFQFPEEVMGIWRKRRTLVYWALIFIYLILPWIHIGGKQALKLDIEHREFIFFGSSFFAHNAPMLLFLFLGFIFTIGFITSIWGRVWCGWACPQTVFIDSIFRKIEIFVEGKPRERMRLEQSAWNFEKVWKRTLKWFLYLIVSLHISHTFLGYFVGTRELFFISLGNPLEHLTLFSAMLIITSIVILDFGWFREQFCIIACPYGRFQSVMMDDNSMTIVYDPKRGEPRRQAGMQKDEHGDCINCYACVKACPTGIDIRRGVQLECIACTNCIDACDDIMTKTHRSTGLIRYDSQNNLDGKKTKVIRPRNIIYLGALIVVITGLIYSINLSTDLIATVLRGPGTPFRMVSQTRVLNHFQVTLDQSGTISNKKIGFKILPASLADQIDISTPRNPFSMKKNHKRVNIFLKFDKDILEKGSKKIQLEFENMTDKKSFTKEVILVGPIE